jgi:ankyrin repeat protein
VVVVFLLGPLKRRLFGAAHLLKPDHLMQLYRQQRLVVLLGKNLRCQPNMVKSLLNAVLGESPVTTSLLQLQTHDNPWTQGFNLSPNNGQSQNNYDLTSSTNFGEPLVEMHLGMDTGMNFIAPRGPNLHETILHGTEDEVNNLLSSGISVTSRDRVNNSPLHTAILKRDASITKALLNYGADVNAAGFRQQTPLHMAVGSKALMQLLIKHHPDLSSRDDEGNTALHLLLRLEEWWEIGDTKATVELLLSSGADINITNRLGESPLHQVVTQIQPQSEGYLDMLAAFLDYQPNITLPMRNGSLLFPYFLEKSLKNISLMVPSYSIPKLALTTFQCLKRFLVLGADPNAIIRGVPLLNYCLEKGVIRENDASWEFLMLLLQKADVDLSGPDGNCPLHCTIARDTCHWEYGYFPSLKIASELIRQKANVNRANAASVSPLELLMSGPRRYNYIKFATLLIQSGAVTTRLTSTGKTLFDLMKNASKAEQVALTKMLLQADLKSQPDPMDITTGPTWLEIWRSACKEQQWHRAKDRLADLEDCESRPSIKDFDVYAFLAFVEHRLEIHKSQLKLWQANNLEQSDASYHRQEYCAILRDFASEKRKWTRLGTCIFWTL